uniref:Major facilitator superfamily (MFS) profile domain-containing protein n=1 Tax=Bracon brevicornis TaxID=1563983 RepID=A0A6V7J377_9HYME
MMYIVKIIDQVKAPIDPYVASITYGCAQLSGCWLSTLTVDRYGRRPLLLLSCSAMAMSHCIIGTFFSLQSSGYCLSGYGWVPVAAVTVFGFSYASGVGPLAIVVSNEVFNPELASICNSIFLIGYSIIAFALLKLFPFVVGAIGFHNCFFVLMCTCTMGFFVILFTIPETKGRSLESIRDELQGRNGKIDNTEEEIPLH